MSFSKTDNGKTNENNVLKRRRKYIEKKTQRNDKSNTLQNKIKTTSTKADDDELMLNILRCQLTY